METPQDRIKAIGNGWSKDATPEQIEAALRGTSIEDYHSFVEKAATQSAGYWGGVTPPAVIDETYHDRSVEELAEEYVDTAKAATDESQIEVKYQPNRAERRARERQLKRSVRRGQRAYDRNIKAMEAEMTPEQIERARALAAKAMGRG